jgi:hypothetical protein
LARSSQIELGQISFVANISCLYPTYVRGESYFAAGQGKAAADEFQKVINHSGIVYGQSFNNNFTSLQLQRMVHFANWLRD